jgi:SAM-dependent methyltransferase
VNVGDKGFKSLVAAAYDQAASAFAGFADRHVYRHLARPLAGALAGVDGPVLDVAAGSGALGRLLAVPVVAIDLSPAQLAGNPLAARVCGDAERLPFADGAFAAAACAFGVNHLPDPLAAVREMARVAPVAALLTWSRPEVAYAPKLAVQAVIDRHVPGAPRSAVGRALDGLGDAVGSPGVLHGLLTGAGLTAEAGELAGEVPWPGAEAFVDYRLAMVTVPDLGEAAEAVRREAVQAVAALPAAELAWRPRLVLAVGRRG